MSNASGSIVGPFGSEFDGSSRVDGFAISGSGQAFVANPITGQFASVNLSTGSASLIGTGATGILSMEFDGATLFATQFVSNLETNLLAIDTTTGQSTLVGPIGFGGVGGLTSTGSASAAVPEPSTFAIIALGLIGMAGYGWQRRRRAT